MSRQLIQEPRSPAPNCIHFGVRYAGVVSSRCQASRLPVVEWCRVADDRYRALVRVALNPGFSSPCDAGGAGDLRRLSPSWVPGLSPLGAYVVLVSSWYISLMLSGG